MIALPEVQGVVIVLCVKELRMARSKDVVLMLDEATGYPWIPRSVVHRLAQEGKIPGQKVGRRCRFHRAVIDRWLWGPALIRAESATAE